MELFLTSPFSTIGGRLRAGGLASHHPGPRGGPGPCIVGPPVQWAGGIPDPPPCAHWCWWLDFTKDNQRPPRGVSVRRAGHNAHDKLRYPNTSNRQNDESSTFEVPAFRHPITDTEGTGKRRIQHADKVSEIPRCISKSRTAIWSAGRNNGIYSRLSERGGLSLSLIHI